SFAKFASNRAAFCLTCSAPANTPPCESKRSLRRQVRDFELSSGALGNQALTRCYRLDKIARLDLSASCSTLSRIIVFYAIKQRRGSPLLAAPDSSRSRFARPKENLLHQRPLYRRGRTRLAHRHVSRRRWHRQARHR